MIYNPQIKEFETIAQLRRAFPRTTIPRNPSAAQLSNFNRVYVEPTEPPEGDVVTQGEPEQDSEGVWRQTWQVRDYTAAELAAQRVALLPDLEQARKDAEAQGVTVNGIRYAGDPDNRQALNESLQFAAAANMTTFAGWKDSDGVFHADHPVADVQAAYEQIGYRRGALIALEGQYAAQLQAGEIDSIQGLSWDV